MFKRFNELSFVIGLFFFIVSLILLISALVSSNFAGRINIYTGIVFLLFGIGMMAIKR
jgi:hypothetical protein